MQHARASRKIRSQDVEPIEAAQGRLDHGPAVAVIDIGSNSVRLVVYEGLTRSPTPIFNEKVLAGLGREVQSTGLLAPDAVDRGLAGADALSRAVRHPAGRAGVRRSPPPPVAMPTTGAAFIAEAERICRIRIDVLSGRREAELAALGVVSGCLSNPTASPATSAAVRSN